MSRAPLQDNGADDFDVIVVGAGPVGLALCGWLAQRGATRPLSVALIDARPRAEAQQDPRVLALSEGSRGLLAPLGWPRETTPITRIQVSQQGHFGRTVIERERHGLDALGHVVRYGTLAAALADGLDRLVAQGANVTRFDGMRALAYRQDDAGVTVPLAPTAALAAPAIQQPAAPSLRGRVLVSAEGGVFRQDTGADAASGDGDAPGGVPAHRPAHGPTRGPTRRDYQQTALIARVNCSRPAHGVAFERFTGSGPLALLPFEHSGAPAADYALVWCAAPDVTARRLASDDATLLTELADAFGGPFGALGRFTSIEGRASFALGMQIGDVLRDRRVAAIGNAAQILHPVAGQGLNLGLRDARTLADALAHLGATPEALADLARRRRVDRGLTSSLTDWLARGFLDSAGPVAVLRGLGLQALDVLPGAKTAFVRQMIFGARR
ncbi:FAD-dependent monooxygenase [Chitinasiproducens palmae]|uniref:2-octaprenyl-6-methoxyphenol hydroxylase n=1 Tax=Chitinasiproducens palmae TaxID=1770053 RepID=A0A1H2PQ66_9BURK|nr:FAD-dependent monooxygenase [Chitinasiproducens palmae]SDV48119.1 2-octaprenyl-6-methoxyphenol hydroxylase [Chitinasiproducens palmae]